jgi:hypothetical protein
LSLKSVSFERKALAEYTVGLLPDSNRNLPSLLDAEARPILSLCCVMAAPVSQRLSLDCVQLSDYFML